VYEAKDRIKWYSMPDPARRSERSAEDIFKDIKLYGAEGSKA
jgi:hypothetical protein